MSPGPAPHTALFLLCTVHNLSDTEGCANAQSWFVSNQLYNVLTFKSRELFVLNFPYQNIERINVKNLIKQWIPLRLGNIFVLLIPEVFSPKPLNQFVLYFSISALCGSSYFSGLCKII